MPAGLPCASQRTSLTRQTPRSQQTFTKPSITNVTRAASGEQQACHASPLQQQQKLSASRQRQQRAQVLICRGAPEQPGYRQSEGASGGGSGGLGGNGPGGGGGGGGDDRHGDDESSSKPTFGWKGWRDRVAADQQFPYKVFIEQIIGVGAAVIGDMSSRPYWGIYELDFVFSTLVVGSIVNFSLMYFLAPTAGSSAAATGLISTLFSDRILRSWGAPAGHMFQPGAFGVSKRLLNFGYKGLIFALVGFGAGIAGTATSNGLLLLRKKMDADFKSQNKPPNVLFNAATWATHMGLSSNLRYQVLNGVDMMMQPAMGPTTFKVLTSLLRTINNIAGGISFVLLAKMAGVQSTATQEA
ncbi:hypothetical protein WJX74_007678 [Apatococcus lobatus]|uniref:Uncharacterized protein n=1 Tax=Apatococcus lobatus TaxID=904363 RepID=A0AAW1QBZ1_9CHLO